MKYRVQLDLNRNGLFNHYLSDITDRVRDSITFGAGFQEANTLEHNTTAIVAPPNNLYLTLDNRDGALFYDSYNADNTSLFDGLLSASIMLKLTIYNKEASKEYIYYTVQVRADSGAYNAQSVSIVCSDATPRLQTTRYEPEVQTDKLTSDCIIDFFKESNIYLPYSASYFLLDIIELDSEALLYDADSEVDKLIYAEDGISILDYVGDAIRETQDDKVLLKNGLAFIYDVCFAEAFGWLYFAPNENRFRWYNRHHDINEASKLIITSSDIIQMITRQTTVANDIRVFYSPREVSSSNEVIFQAQGLPIPIDAGAEAIVGIVYRDSNNKDTPVSALSHVTPEAGIDYIITNSVGSDVSALIRADIELTASGGSFTFTNVTTNTVTIDVLQVRGKSIYTYDTEYARAVDAQSIYNHNSVILPDISFNYVFNHDFAQSIADFLLRKYANMRRIADKVTLMITDDNWGALADINIGDCITLYDEYSKHNRDYIIYGENHEIGIGYGSHYITYILKSKELTPYFALDRDELNDNRIILGY